MANIYIRSESIIFCIVTFLLNHRIYYILKEYNKNGRQHENRIKISSNNLFVNIINSQ